MSELVPTVQAIRNRFDNEEVLFANPAVSDGIKIESSPTDYQITVYPNGEYGYEGFVIDAKAPEGIFGTSAPTRIETSRNSAGLIKIDSVPDVTEDYEDAAGDGVQRVSQQFKARPNPAQEGLLLPGDPGFELFDQLQAELAALKQPVADAIGTLGVTIDPITMYLNEPQKHGAYYQYAGQKDYFTGVRHTESKAIIKRTTDLRVSDANGNTVSVDLNANLEYPFESGKLPQSEYDPLMVYRRGEATIQQNDEIQARTLEMDALMAFAGLYASIRKLYR